MAIALAGCHASSTPPPLAEAELSLAAPCRLALLDTQRPVVALDLAGHEGLRFLLDSGADVTLVDARQAEALGLALRPYAGPATTRGSGGHAATIDSYVGVQQARLGGLELGAFRVSALADDVFEVAGCFGILGQDLLMRLPWILDMQRGEAHLLPPGTDSAGVQSYLEAAHLGPGAWAVTEAGFRPAPFLELSVDGLPAGSVELELDTGATGTSLPERVIAALGLVATGSTTVQGIGGQVERATYDLPAFSLYGLRISMPVEASSLDYGLLGINVLGQLVVVLDGAGGKVWLHHRDEPLGGAETDTR